MWIPRAIRPDRENASAIARAMGLSDFFLRLRLW